MGVSIGSTIWKRKYPRVNLEMKGDVSLLLPEMDKERIPTEVKTLGEGGMMFISSIPLSIGTPLRMRLFHWANVVKFTSKVVWSEPVVDKDSTEFRNGVQFDQISTESLIQIRNIMQTWMKKTRESCHMYVRRRYPRFSVSGVVEVTVPGTKRHFSGMIEKISQGGIGVYTSEKVERGAGVEIEVIMFTGPDTSVYQLTGVVQNFEKQKESGLLGIQFDKIINEKDHADLFFYLTLLSKQFSKYKTVL